MWSYEQWFSADLTFWREGYWVGGSGRFVGRFDMWVTPYTGILTSARQEYFMSKGLSTKTLSCTAANNTKRHSEHGTRNIVCKG